MHPNEGGRGVHAGYQNKKEINTQHFIIASPTGHIYHYKTFNMELFSKYQAAVFLLPPAR